MKAAVAAGPIVGTDSVTFRFPDPEEQLAGIRLLQEIRRPRNEPGFRREGKLWRATFPRSGAARIEYQLELLHRGAGSEVVCDPNNPKRAPGPFGDKSVVEFPGYRAPGWVERRPAEQGTMEEVVVRSRVLRRDMRALIWTSPGVSAGAPVPLLVVHDGPEYSQYSDLLRYLALAVEDEEAPAMRAALLPPSAERNQIYSASAAYARALSHELLPALTAAAPTPPGRAMRAGMGASLGALAMLHAHRTNPAIFGALFLQSGSYFRQRYDRHESGFVRFRRISRFAGTVLASDDWAHPIPVTMTCGRVEENLWNNRAVAKALRAQGYDVHMHEHPDAHNWVSWRDTLRPHLGRLLEKVWT